ncbi:MAG: pyruvate kinase [Mesorhizobium sp.]|nr:pyruvate kinase [Mesorhizobium sp.]
MANSDVTSLLRQVEELRAGVIEDAGEIARGWEGYVERPVFAPSAANFSHYLALRRRDIRSLQRDLMVHGLSSLGRAEGRVLPTLDALCAVLRVLDGKEASPVQADPAFFAGEERLVARTIELFGPRSPHSPIHLMVTAPSEAADDESFMQRLTDLGVEALRINCAHDGPDAWAKMIQHVDTAAAKTGRRMKIMMDLAGPKIRTGEVRKAKGLKRVQVGQELAIALPGRLRQADKSLPSVECTLSEAVKAAIKGERVFIDDGKLETRVTRVEPWGIVVEVHAGPDEDGYKLKPEKGINFPDTDFSVPALTQDDREALAFAAHHADGIEFSFVQHEDDVAELQDALAAERPDDWRSLGLVLKIETLRAVGNLPSMLVRAAGKQPTAIMIARGDLAVEIGFARLAEIQEELLWLGEAAQIPVIWATQVLESQLRTGIPSRGEMTDAAMAVRAECVMLNKGPFLFQTIAELDHLWSRMDEHIHKKTPQLRRLTSW